MAYSTLINSGTVAARLGDQAFALVDCRYDLNDEAWGEREYRAGHIPGAVYAHLSHDLAGAKTDRSGRHPLPDPGALARFFGRLGIASDVQVAAYDQDTGMYASRLWWLLRWLGHEAVAVLDGGFARWLAEGRPTSAGQESRSAREFTGSARSEMSVGADEVTKLSQSRDWRLVDARAPERYRGDSEPIDKIAGHIPGAANHFFKGNLDEDGAFRLPEDLRRRFDEVVGDVPMERVVCYCGSGVTACHKLLALEHAGLRGAKLYPGSWSEWSSDPSRPIEQGDGDIPKTQRRT